MDLEKIRNLLGVEVADKLSKEYLEEMVNLYRVISRLFILQDKRRKQLKPKANSTKTRR